MRHRLLILGSLAATALAVAAVAAASNLTATATVTGTAGISLSLPANPALVATLDGSDQLLSYAPVLGLIDARGSGTGWNLTMAATDFDDGSGHTFAAGSVSAVATACHAGSSCTAATSSGVSYPLTLSTTASKVVNASAGTGMGKIDVTPTVQVTVPGNAFAGTYTSTVTLAATSGP